MKRIQSMTIMMIGLLAAAPAFAQQAPTTQPQPQPQAQPAAPTSTTTESNGSSAGGVVAGGMTAIFAPYVAGLPFAVTGVTRDGYTLTGQQLWVGNHNDQNLFVPVAGPWMDLAARGNSASPGTKALLIMDGAIQAAGAAAVLGGLIMAIVDGSDSSSKAAKIDADKAAGKKQSFAKILGVSPTAGDGAGLTVLGAF